MKKHEILFPLIKEFDENKCMQHAKDLLDDYILKDLRWEHMHGYYSLKNLHRILKNHKREDGIKNQEKEISEKVLMHYWIFFVN